MNTLLALSLAAPLPVPATLQQHDLLQSRAVTAVDGTLDMGGKSWSVAVSDDGTRAFIGRGQVVKVLHLDATSEAPYVLVSGEDLVPIPFDEGLGIPMTELLYDSEADELFIAAGSYGVYRVRDALGSPEVGRVEGYAAPARPVYAGDVPWCYDVQFASWAGVDYLLALFGALEGSELRVYERDHGAGTVTHLHTIQVTSSANPGVARGLAVKNRRAYIAAGEAGLLRVWWPNPAAVPVQGLDPDQLPVAASTTFREFRDVAMGDKHLYATADEIGMFEVRLAAWGPTLFENHYPSSALDGSYAHKVEALVKGSETIVAFSTQKAPMARMEGAPGSPSGSWGWWPALLGDVAREDYVSGGSVRIYLFRRYLGQPEPLGNPFLDQWSVDSGWSDETKLNDDGELIARPIRDFALREAAPGQYHVHMAIGRIRGFQDRGEPTSTEVFDYIVPDVVELDRVDSGGQLEEYPDLPFFQNVMDGILSLREPATGPLAIFGIDAQGQVYGHVRVQDLDGDDVIEIRAVPGTEACGADGQSKYLAGHFPTGQWLGAGNYEWFLCGQRNGRLRAFRFDADQPEADWIRIHVDPEDDPWTNGNYGQAGGANYVHGDVDVELGLAFWMRGRVAHGVIVTELAAIEGLEPFNCDSADSCATCVDSTPQTIPQWPLITHEELDTSVHPLDIDEWRNAVAWSVTTFKLDPGTSEERTILATAAGHYLRILDLDLESDPNFERGLVTFHDVSATPPSPMPLHSELDVKQSHMTAIGSIRIGDTPYVVAGDFSGRVVVYDASGVLTVPQGGHLPSVVCELPVNVIDGRRDNPFDLEIDPDVRPDGGHSVYVSCFRLGIAKLHLWVDAFGACHLDLEEIVDTPGFATGLYLRVLSDGRKVMMLGDNLDGGLRALGDW